MKKSYITLIALVLVIVTAMVLFGAWITHSNRLPPQPIEFNHRLHLEKVQGINCYDCHQFVRSQMYAGLPSKYVCFDCHPADIDEGDTEADALKPKFASLMAFADIEEDVPWHRVTMIAADVFFSHRRHVTVGKVDCRECHPKMPDMLAPPRYGPAQMSMDDCIECHKKQEASVDCISCHR